MAPPILAYRVHSLPPILHMQAQNPMSSYSKGAQGLSVFLRVHGIFTATAISPSLWPRQCGDRYAIQASDPIRRVTALQSPVFLINRRLGRFAAAASRSRREGVHSRRRPFSRSYGASMPSSLTVVLPIASVCSTRPPVSVLVRAPTALPRGFSRKHGLTGFARSLRLASQAPCAADFHAARPTRFHGDVQNPARLPFSVAPSVMPRRRRCGNVCPLRIGYASRPRLSSRLTLGGLASPRNP